MLSQGIHKGVWAAIVLATMVVGARPRAATACLAHYRSPEWQVANCPLIVIGEVEKIEPGLAGKFAGRSGFGEREGGSDKETPPTVATVRILRILKGRYPDARIRIGSGPIPTCGGDVHVRFEVGERRIFLLPFDPKDGASALHFGGSVLPLTETSLIESRIARAIAYRAAYLADLEKEKPKRYAAAQELARSLRAESKTWPLPTYDKKTGDYTSEFKSAIKRLQERLSPYSVETIIAAQAVDWLNDELNIWWRHQLWDRAIRDVCEARQKQAAAFQRQWVRKTLTAAGVERQQIDAYLKAARDEIGRAVLTFPPRLPFLWNSLRGKHDGPVLTTDFILHYYAYDRGGMLVAYAPDFSAAVLADLDMRRVKPLVASLYQSDGERLRWLAQQAIGYTSGTGCVDIVLDDLVNLGHEWAWRVLEHRRQPKATAARLAALIDLGSREYTVWRQQAMWRALQRGECFHEACLEKALAALGQLEAAAATPKSKNAKASEASDERQELAKAVREYLAAAKASREGAKPATMTADAYRQWFKAHPAKKVEDE
jgi:hypothetical protein